MKITAKSMIIVLFVLLTAQIASAYYCPSTGRWLSRDPIGEPGFQALQMASVGRSVAGSPKLASSRWINRDLMGEFEAEALPSTDANSDEEGLIPYNFVENNPVNSIDKYGLICVKTTTDLVDYTWVKGNIFKRGLIATFIGSQFPVVSGKCACSCKLFPKIYYPPGIPLADPPLPVKNVLIIVYLKITIDVCSN
jgi:hypothetical protein